MSEPNLRIDGFGPLPIVQPATPADLGEVVRRAAAAGEAVYPLGGRTRLGLGLPPGKAGSAVDLTGLTRVIDYPARDMTITVQAGIRMAELARRLAGEGQRLPVDVPDPERATLGGVIATNTSGSRRPGSGTMRDYVIGISTMNDEGQETKAGGRVVKNVAGYDLCKLHTGALGTLGIITQVTLKVRPVPESQALLTFGCTADGLEGLLDRLHASRTRPMCVDLVNARAAALLRQRTGVDLPAQPWVLVAGFEDSEPAVNWQVQQLIKELTDAGILGVEALAGQTAAPLWQALAGLSHAVDDRLALQASLLPGRLAGWCLLADREPGELALHAHAVSGIVHGVAGGGLTLEQARGLVGRLGAEACAASGNLTLPRCPTAWKTILPVWGQPRPDLWLMRQVKARLDPQGLFNPGRFVGGI